jgi:hypothetical protein
MCPKREKEMANCMPLNFDAFLEKNYVNCGEIQLQIGTIP